MMFSPCSSMPGAIPQWNYKRCTACSHIENEIKAGKIWKMHYQGYHPPMKKDGNASQNKLQSGMISNADNIMIVWSVSLHLLYIEKKSMELLSNNQADPPRRSNFGNPLPSPDHIARRRPSLPGSEGWEVSFARHTTKDHTKTSSDASPLACRTPSCRNEKGDNVEIQWHHVSWTYLAKEPKDWTCLKTFRVELNDNIQCANQGWTSIIINESKRIQRSSESSLQIKTLRQHKQTRQGWGGAN